MSRRYVDGNDRPTILDLFEQAVRQLKARAIESRNSRVHRIVHGINAIKWVHTANGSASISGGEFSMARLRLCLFLLLSATVPPFALAESESLDEELVPLIKAHQGRVAVSIRNLKSGTEFLHQPDAVMPTASLIKVAVMAEAYRQAEAGQLKLTDAVVLREEDKVPGSGILTPHFSSGVRMSLRDAIQLMMAYSDNTATNLVLQATGLEETCAMMKSLGLEETRINAMVFRRDTSIDLKRSRTYGLGSTTAREMLQLLTLLEQGELVSKQASQQMLEHMRACQDDRKLAASLPSDVVIAHKGGAVSDVRCDAGIIESPAGPIAICVLTADNEDRSWSDNDAERLCARIARRAYDHFNPPWKQGTTSRPGPLATGSSGQLVEHLQRTLNARLNPSPELSVDGDFGPVTQAAVLRFQESRELEASGVVEAETWEALGPLVTAPTPVPEPDVVNNEILETEPADVLDGRPFVTSRAWAVADGRTGELLWSENENTPLDIASTTKIMTAWLVIQLATADASVLDETLVFSRRADQTPGSTAGIRTGERISVREALYGLLLPSGNDASVALAEHFGQRLHKTGLPTEANGESERPSDSREDRLADESPDGDPLALFVASMNREAARLGMADTSYRNPHGLTAEGHVSSARDLLKLAAAALSNDLFQQYVSTRQRGCRVEGPDGYTRNVRWKNTNQLLGIDGYLGVKTGTTSAAGACLVSVSQRGDDRLLLVVLGSAASAARYADSRNLYRWAWRQRVQPPQPK